MTRMRWLEFTAVTAPGTLPTVVFFTAFAEDLPDSAFAVYIALSSAVGLAVLGWIFWRERALSRGPL